MEKPLGQHALQGVAGKRHAGLSLIEALAVLAVAGLVAATAVMLHNAARVEQRTIQIVAEYEAIKANVKALYAGLGYGHNQDLNASLISTRRVPTTLRVTEPDTLTNMFGGSVLVFGETEKFRVSFDRLPREVCIGLLTAIAKSGDWYQYRVLPAGAGLTGSSPALPTPMTPAQANSECNVNSGGPVRVILWSH